MEEAMLERLLEKGVSMVEYRCGIKNGEVTQIEHADFHDYRWSGCIEGDKAILEWKDYLRKKIGEEMSVTEHREEALHKHTEKMLAEWYGRETKREEETSEEELREVAMYKCIEKALAVWHALGKK